jgi:MFS family permease
VTFLVSAFAVGAMDVREAVQERVPDRHLWREVAEGLRFVMRDRFLRPTALCTITLNLFEGAFDALAVVFLFRTVDLPASEIGLLFGIASFGGMVGVALVGPLTRRFGDAPALAWCLSCTWVFGLLIPFTSSGIWLALFAIGEFAKIVGVLIYSITNTTFRQEYTPLPLLGRANATMRVVGRAALAVGALTGGLLGGALGLQPALIVACTGGALAGLWLVFSPLRRMHDFPVHPDRKLASAS